MYSGSLNNGQVQYSNHKRKSSFAWVKVTYALNELLFGKFYFELHRMAAF